MKRLPDWPERFHAYIDSIKEVPFDWGENNCGFICAGAVEAITGKDMTVGFKRAKTAKKLLEIMKAKGFNDLSELVESKLRRIPISRAKVGDIAAVKSDDPFGYSLGIVNGETILVFNDKGMGLIPLFSATHAFEV